MILDSRSLLSGLALTILAACGGSPADKLLGKYENANDKIAFELKTGGIATMTDEGQVTDLTWEPDGADKLVIHGKEGINLVYTRNSEGNLSDGMGSVFIRK